MIIPLPQSQYRRVSHLFEGPHLRLHIDAVVEGNSPGRIWVDDLENPQSAYMWDKGHCHYFVGEGENREFADPLKTLLAREIIPHAKEGGFSFFKAYHTRCWERALGEMFEGMQLNRRGRIFHGFTKLFIERNEMPSGFSLECIDGILLREKWKNIECVREEISSCWNSVDEFLRKGFGFWVRHDDEIAGWCTEEYLSGRVCGIGIETLGQFQKKGLATVMAQTFVGHCLSVGLTPHWDSWDDNGSSLRVAEKVGFERVCKYMVYSGSFE